MKVFFIRHGESMANAKKIKSSAFHHLNDLTPKGIIQIQEASTKIKEKINCVYASPYKRTISSAKIFIENRSEKLSLQVDDRLREINYGEYQDDLGNPEMDRITREQIAGDYEIRFGKGENRREIITRFFSFLIDAFEKHFDQNIVVFTHGRAISIIEYEFCKIKNIGKEHTPTGNGTIKTFDIDDSTILILKKHLQYINNLKEDNKTKKLTKKEIKKIINNNYGINKIFSIEKINRGTADIYIIETNTRKMLFKYFQDKYNQIEVDKEISIINFLNQRNIPTPKYITTIDNKYSIIYKNRVIIMQEFIDGTTKDKNLENEKEMLDSAMYLGKIIHELEKYNHDVEFNPSNWFKLTSDEAIMRHKELINSINPSDKNANQIKIDLNKRIEMLNNLKLLELSDIDKTSIKFTHGDYSVMQFIYEKNEIKAILDFVSACDMPIVWEIIRSYSYIDKECINGTFNINNLVKYVKKFQKYVPLNEYDLKYMPYIYLIQLIKSTFGYKQYLIDGNENLLGFGILRTKICLYLYEHAEEISNILLEKCNDYL